MVKTAALALLVAGALLSRAPVQAQAPCGPLAWQKLTASDGSNIDRFGWGVAIHGGVVAIGAPGRDGAGNDSGAAYIYRHDGTVWREEAKLVASDAGPGDELGDAIAVGKDLVVVGAPHHEASGVDSGAAYVYRRVGASWVEEAKLVASDEAAGDLFGWAVATSGDVILVGAWLNDHSGLYDPGAGYVYRHGPSGWIEEAKLVSNDVTHGDNLGWWVALEDEVAVLGAWRDDEFGADSGAAYVFRHSGSAWTQEAKLLAADGAAKDWFGDAVSVSGDTILVGSKGDDDNGDYSGSAHVFRFDGVTWTERQKLYASDGTTEDRFGSFLSLSGNVAVLGAWHDDNAGGVDAGSAYLFRFDGTSWHEAQRFAAPDGAPADEFGAPVAVDHGVAVIGVARDDDHGPGSGSAWVYAVSGPELSSAPPAPKAGDQLTIRCAPGKTDTLLLLAAVAIDGAPIFQPVALGRYDADFRWAITATVPPGLSGLDVALQSFSISLCGQPLASNRAEVSFQ